MTITSAIVLLSVYWFIILFIILPINVTTQNDEKNKKGGIHHICFEVEDINSAILSLEKDGATVLGDGEAKIGAHGNPVIFLHPKDFNGTLIELEEVKQ